MQTRMVRFIMLAVFVIITIMGQKSIAEEEAAISNSQKFVQDRFAISFWVDPPVLDKYYADIAAANFTMVIGRYGADTPEKIKEQIRLCEKYDLKAIIATGGLPPEQLLTGPNVWGYTVRDEPSVRDFPELKKIVDGIRKAKPGKLTLINLFPNYATLKQLGAESYDEYVEKFLQELNPAVLSTDHYPYMNPDEDSRDKYCSNLEVLRKYSMQRNIPFWNFFLAMPHGAHYDPTEGQIRWQVYTSLAYGAKGVMYFCYWTPRASGFRKGGAILTVEGRKTRHYDEAKRINFGLKNLGPSLMKLTSTGVYRVRPNDDTSRVLAETPIQGITDDCGRNVNWPMKNRAYDEYLVGVFKHEDGREAVLLNNYRDLYAAWPTVEFKVPLTKVREICKKTGKEIPVVDASPDQEGLQISLDAGEGRLFIISK